MRETALIIRLGVRNSWRSILFVLLSSAVFAYLITYHTETVGSLGGTLYAGMVFYVLAAPFGIVLQVWWAGKRARGRAQSNDQP